MHFRPPQAQTYIRTSSCIIIVPLWLCPTCHVCRTIMEQASSGTDSPGLILLHAIGKFLLMFCGSAVLGIVSALASALVSQSAIFYTSVFWKLSSRLSLPLSDGNPSLTSPNWHILYSMAHLTMCNMHTSKSGEICFSIHFLWDASHLKEKML